MFSEKVLDIVEEGGFNLLMDRMLEVAWMNAMAGELQQGRLRSRIGEYYVNVIDGFEYTADPKSRSVQVKNLENHDPFLSCDEEGTPVRKHYGRYNAPNRILG